MSSCGENLFQPGLREVLCADASGIKSNDSPSRKPAANLECALGTRTLTRCRALPLRLSHSDPRMPTSTSEETFEEGWHSSTKGYFSTRGLGKEKARAVVHPGLIREKTDLANHARRRFRRKRHARRVRSLAALRGGGARSNSWFYLARWDRQVFTFADEGQAVLLLIPVDADQVTQVDLFGCQEVCQWINHVALDGAFEVPRTVALVCAFLQEEVPARIRHAEQELPLGSLENSLLYLAQLDFEYPLKLFAPQRMKHHHFVKAVHEFRRKLAASGFHGSTFDLFIAAGSRLLGCPNKAHATLHEFRNFATAKVRRQENDGLGEIHAPVVAQGERGLIQHPQEQLPQGVAGFFDLVEKQEAELQLFAMARRQRFLSD